MAAVAPSESPKRLNSPAEEVDTSGEKTVTEELQCSSKRPDESAHDTTTENPGGEPKASVGSDGGCTASHSEVSVGSGAGADKTKCNSPEDTASAPKMAEPPGDEQRGLDWSEPRDGAAKATKHGEERGKKDAKDVKEEQQQTHVDANSVADADLKLEEENGPHNQKISQKEEPEEPMVDVDTVEDMVEEADRRGTANVASKPRRCRLMCKECGKCFTRRETFNLHRHFHAHEDELTPLTCKECGLTFQHRSSLIKHRNEHKEKEEQLLLSPKKEVQTEEEGSFECAQCEKFFSTVDKLRDHNCSSAEEKPYHCPLCRQEFQYKVSVTKHMMAHSQESSLTCGECNQAFPNHLALRFHQRCHSALKPYECPECGMVFKHYSVMEDHRRKHTDNTRSHLCNTCGKTFKYSSLLHQHQYLHTGQKPFCCPECGKRFAFAQNMKAHCRQHRLRKATSLASTEQPGKQTPMSAPETVKAKENMHKSEELKRTFNCPLCTQTYGTAADLRVHMLVHEAEHERLERAPRPPKEINKSWDKGHTCPHCPSTYRDEAGLNLHLLSTHKSVAQYLEKAVAASQKQLIEKAPTKFKTDGVKPYKCSECGKTFRHRSVLELHMRIHSKDKPYQCKVCGKGFRFSSYLQQHLIIHTGKKPYKCPDCGKDFAFLQNMKTHQRLHQEKPFRCTSCRKGYSDETQLQQHMLSHNGEKPHKCHLCDKSFGLAYLLRDHMNTHTGERPHRCDECHKTFSWFSSLLVHQKIHARKRQSLSQYSSIPTGTRARGRGRRGAKSSWGWSRLLGSSGTVSTQPTSYSVSRDAELSVRAAQPQAPSPSSKVDVQARQPKELHPTPVQWKVDGGEVMPVPSPHQPELQNPRPDWTDGVLISAQTAATSHMKDSHQTVVPKKPTPSSSSEKPGARSSTAEFSAVVPSGPLPQKFSLSSSFVDGAALWSVRPATLANSQISPNKLGQELQLSGWPGTTVSTLKEVAVLSKKEERATLLTVSQLEKTRNGFEPQKQRTSTSVQKDQSSPTLISIPVSQGQTPLGISKTTNSPDKTGTNQDQQQKQVLSGRTNQTTTQKVPISIQYEPHRFGQGVGTTVWGFQAKPALLTGQLKPGNGQDSKQQPIVTGTQIIINQASPFLSPTLTPLSSVTLPGSHTLALARPPNVFFAPQAVMTERPQLTQTLPLPQPTSRTEPQKVGPRLPLPPDRLLQCMICGSSLPREVDLQMHYLQHAKGEI